MTIPDGVTSIGDNASRSLTSSVMIPNSVTIIGDHAFLSCNDLTKVNIGSGVTNIGDEAFIFCFYLTNITFNGNAPSVGSNWIRSRTNGRSEQPYHILLSRSDRVHVPTWDGARSVELPNNSTSCLRRERERRFG